MILLCKHVTIVKIESTFLTLNLKSVILTDILIVKWPYFLHKRAKKGNYTNKVAQDILILIQLEQFTQYKNANGASQLYTSTFGRY